MKKIALLLFCLIVCLITTLGGCDNTPQFTEVDITFDPDEPVTLRVAVSNDPNEKVIAEAFANAYMDKYPNKTVQVEVVPGDYVNSLVFDFNAGILQDIMWMGDDNVAYLADLGVLANLTKFMRKEEELNVENKFNPSLYYESMIKLGRLRQTGDMYMFPRDYNKIVIFYNKDLLSQIGVDEPDDNNWTWEEFMDYVALVSSKLNQKGLTLSSGYEALEGANLDWKAIVYPMLKSYGGRFLDDNGNPAFKTQAMENTLNNIAAFALNGYSQPIGQTGARGSFVAKKAVMYIGSRPTVGALLQQNINFGVVSYPQTGTKQDGKYVSPMIGSGTTGYGMNSTTEHPGDAWNFLRFIMSEDGQNAFSMTGSCVPILKSMAEDPDAEWRKHPVIDNVEAFVLYPERDCTVDIINTAPAAKEQLLMGNYAAMIFDVTNGTRTAANAIDYYYDEIVKALL